MSYKLNKFPDGASYVNGVDSQPVTFKINSYEDLWHLNQYVDAFKSQFGFAPSVFIPNLIDAQADKRFNEGESSGLKIVCDFLNTMEFKQILIYHPHNAEVVEIALKNSIIVNNTQFIKIVLDDIDQDNLILMSADAGGFKPLMKLCDEIDWKGTSENASKSRKGGIVGEQRLPMDDFGGKDVLIVDDIAVYGGTFKGLAKLLRKANVGKLYLAVSHITVQNHFPNPKRPDDKPIFEYFDKVFTTNSKFEDYWVKDIKGEPTKPENLRVVKMFNYE